MRAGVSGVVALLVLLAVVVVGYSSLFTVRETEQVLLVRLGEPVRVRVRHAEPANRTIDFTYVEKETETE